MPVSGKIAISISHLCSLCVYCINKEDVSETYCSKTKAVLIFILEETVSIYYLKIVDLRVTLSCISWKVASFGVNLHLLYTNALDYYCCKIKSELVQIGRLLI